MNAVVDPKRWLWHFDGHQEKNYRHTTPLQTNIAFIVPRPKGIGRWPKTGTGNNQSRQKTTSNDNWCSNRKDIHSNSNDLSSPVIYVSPPLNNSVINPLQLSSVRQQLSSSSQNTPHDNRCFNIKDSDSNNNELPSPVIYVSPTLNNSVINTP